MIAVTRPVYASTTVTAVNLADSSSRAKDSNPQPCYPDICFAVDNFDNAFEDLVSSSSSSGGCDRVRCNSRSNSTLSDAAAAAVPAAAGINPDTAAAAAAVMHTQLPSLVNTLLVLWLCVTQPTQ